MLRWLFIGALCAFYRLFLEESIFSAVSDLREALRLMKLSRRAAQAPPARSQGEVFLGGFIAALILLFWPFYLVVAFSKLIGFTIGIKHKEVK